MNSKLFNMKDLPSKENVQRRMEIIRKLYKKDELIHTILNLMTDSIMSKEVHPAEKSLMILLEISYSHANFSYIINMIQEVEYRMDDEI